MLFSAKKKLCDLPAEHGLLLLMISSDVPDNRSSFSYTFSYALLSQKKFVCGAPSVECLPSFMLDRDKFIPFLSFSGCRYKISEGLYYSQTRNGESFTVINKEQDSICKDYKNRENPISTTDMLLVTGRTHGGGGCNERLERHVEAGTWALLPGRRQAHAASPACRLGSRVGESSQ